MLSHIAPELGARDCWWLIFHKRQKILLDQGVMERGWDSNPRYGYPYNGFRVLRFSCCAAQ